MENWRRQRDWEVTRREAEAMIREGKSIPEVAHKLVVANSTVHRWMTKGGFRLKDLEREAAGEPPLPRPDWLAREQYRKAGGGELPPEYAERVARAQEEQAAAAKERVALMRENGGKLAVPEVDPDAFARRAVAEAERLMGEGLYDLAERSMRIAERLARVRAFLAVGAKAGAVDGTGDGDAGQEETPDEMWRRQEAELLANAKLRKSLLETSVGERRAPAIGMTWEEYEPIFEASYGDPILGMLRAIRVMAARKEAEARGGPPAALPLWADPPPPFSWLEESGSEWTSSADL